jgi:NAD(P)-dependent dehydrogenase (short-subunit alcohol dehydrogenase family)
MIDVTIVHAESESLRPSQLSSAAAQPLPEEEHMSRVLDGKVAIVTGGSHSIGRAFSEALAREGAQLVIADIRDGAKVAEEIARANNVEAMFHRTDVSRETDVAALAGAIKSRFGRADILVNNAALFAELPKVDFRNIPVETFDDVLAVNVRGPFLMAKHLAPLMTANGRGKIINIASGTAYKGQKHMAAYVTSKAAIVGLTRALARDLGPENINVNSIAPGFTESASVMEHPHQRANTDATVAGRAMPRKEVPDDLVGTLVFLASPASDFVTGQTIAVDGGSVML